MINFTIFIDISKLSVWYGVDTLMEKYPQNGAYVFCNPSPSDIDVLDMMQTKFENMKFNIYTKNKGFIMYNKNSLTPNIELLEIEIFKK